MTWTEYVIRGISPKEAARIRGVPVRAATARMRQSEHSLKKRGWYLQDGQVPIRPGSMTIEDVETFIQTLSATGAGGNKETKRMEPVQAKRIEKSHELPLTLREMVILGWDTPKILRCRGTYGRNGPRSVTEARKKLRDQGWVVVAGQIAVPPADAPASGRTHADEIASAQRRSNWLMRLPANAK